MAQASTEELLANVPLFKDLSKKHLRQVAGLATRLDAEPGKVLTKQGEPGHEFVVILDGQVEVRVDDEVVATRGAGEYFGEISLLERGPRTATVTAITPVVIEVIGEREFTTLLNDEPEIGEKIKATAEDRLGWLKKSGEH